MASIGDRIALVSTSDPYAQIPPGTEGVVTYVDPVTRVVTAEFDSGHTLGLIPGEDRWRAGVTRVAAREPSTVALAYSSEHFSGTATVTRHPAERRVVVAIEGSVQMRRSFEYLDGQDDEFFVVNRKRYNAVSILRRVLRTHNFAPVTITKS